LAKSERPQIPFWIRPFEVAGAKDLLIHGSQGFAYPQTLAHGVEIQPQRIRQWTWVGDDSVFKKYGEQLGLVGTWWSGQEHRVLSGIDGVLLVVVIGDGKLVVPVDFAIRRPDPHGPGAPCRDKLHWLQGMLDGRFAAFRWRGVALPPPMVVADSWFSDSKLMQHVHKAHQGTLLVEGKVSYGFTLADGRQIKGHDLIEGKAWRW
jgi:hypothetical protein